MQRQFPGLELLANTFISALATTRKQPFVYMKAAPRADKGTKISPNQKLFSFLQNKLKRISHSLRIFNSCLLIRMKVSINLFDRSPFLIHLNQIHYLENQF